MIKTVKAFLAVSAIAISATSALADREELNSGFHGNTPYQIVAPQGLPPSAAKSYGQAPIPQATQTYIRGRGANAYGQARPFSNSASIKVYEWGEYQGQDPDRNVRLLLRRDFHN